MTSIETPDGAALAIRAEGSGPDILLVSGLGGTAAFWSPIIPPLARNFASRASISAALRRAAGERPPAP